MEKDMCICGWTGDDFEAHRENTKYDGQVHVETSPLLNELFPRSSGVRV